MSKLSEDAVKNDQEIGLPLIEVEKIYLDAEFNCRGAFRPMDCLELARDVARHGLQQPVVVRPLRSDDNEEVHLLSKGFTHKMIAGHRRVTAYKINEHPVIPAILKDKDIDDFTAKDINAVENLQRTELNLQQECNAIRHYWIADWSREEIGERIGKSPGWVQIRVMLLAMPQVIQDAAGQGYIKGTDIRELHKYKNPAEQLKAAGILRDRRKYDKSAKGITRLIKKREKASTKKMRGKVEIFEMMEHLRDTFSGANTDEIEIPLEDIISPEGNSIATRSLAWAAGEIDNLTFATSIKAFAMTIGVAYTMPEYEQE